MAPKMGRMAKSAAKNKSAPKKPIVKDTTKHKSPKKTKEKTPEKKEPVELKEEQKTLQEKMEIEVFSKVKVEPGESASVEKKDLSCFVSSAKKTKNEDLKKAYEHYQSLGRFDKQKQDRH